MLAKIERGYLKLRQREEPMAAGLSSTEQVAGRGCSAVCCVDGGRLAINLVVPVSGQLGMYVHVAWGRCGLSAVWRGEEAEAVMLFEITQGDCIR